MIGHFLFLRTQSHARSSTKESSAADGLAMFQDPQERVFSHWSIFSAYMASFFFLQPPMTLIPWSPGFYDLSFR